MLKDCSYFPHPSGTDFSLSLPPTSSWSVRSAGYRPQASQCWVSRTSLSGFPVLEVTLYQEAASPPSTGASSSVTIRPDSGHGCLTPGHLLCAAALWDKLWGPGPGDLYPLGPAVVLRGLSMGSLFSQPLLCQGWRRLSWWDWGDRDEHKVKLWAGSSPARM